MIEGETMKSQHKQTASTSRRKHPSGLRIAIALVILVLAVSLAAVALATSGTVTVTSASSSTLGEQITVDADGRTLYVLSPETTRHLLCKSSACLRFWPPLTVRSSRTKLKAGPGVHGHLAILRRSNGMLQVTLGGLPLYRYSGDGAKGETNGQHIHSFGGIWHVLPAARTTNPTPTSTAPTTPTTPSTTPTTPPTPMPTTPPTPTTPNSPYVY
jgi:predicted lipoprotein with Yx(FWY)xxD motif